ncbi:MAG: hypothetical protein R2747_17920 [Pyrinomonadaceae bacterium]
MKVRSSITKTVLFLIFSLLVATQSGCGLISAVSENFSSVVGLNETGTVIANTAQIRSSYAVVAADLLEVKRGDKLDVLDEVEFEKVQWFRVRANDEDKTEGWIEAQNVITNELLEKSKALADEVKDLPAQATGQLRAASNLRLSPEISDSNLLYKLDNGSGFEIVDWKYVPKEQDISGDGDANSNQSKPKNPDIEAAKEKDEPEKIDDKYDIWYRVRLDPSVSPAPAGWLFGRQIELQVPSDIVFYQTNVKKFVTWQRLDSVASDDDVSPNTTVKITRPGSWVILSRTNEVKARDGVEPDFDGILLLGYDKINQQHYTIRRIEGVWGQLPLKVEGSVNNKTFTVQLLNTDGKMEEKQFSVFKEGNGNLKATIPDGIAMEGRK